MTKITIYGIISGCMKILIVHNRYRIRGGEDSVVENETALLKAHGHTVLSYIRSNDEISGTVRTALGSLFSLKTYREIKALIRKEHPDIVHVHNTIHLISPSVYYAALSEKVPVVQTVHNFRFMCPNGLFFRDGHCCEECVNCGLHRALVHRCYRGSFAQTLMVCINTLIHRATGIYGKLNYITLSDFDRAKQRKAGRIFVKPNFVPDGGTNVYDPDSPYYIYVGRLEREKGIAVLAQAFRTNGKKLVVIGEGSCLDRLKSYKKKHGTDNIDIKGALPHEETMKYLSGARALIAPSEWYETFGMTVIEAYSAGVPVIANDFGNMGALVEENVTGMKYAHTAAEMNKCIERFEKADREKMSKNAFAAYLNRYSESSNYEELMKIYKEVSA